MAHTLQIECILPAPYEKVMEYISRADYIRRWSGEEVVMELEPLGTVRLFDNWVQGNLVHIDGKSLKMYWRCADWDASWAASLVEIVLSAEAEDTRVVVKHSLLPNEEELKKQKANWDDFYFTPLEDYLMVRYHR